jgi:hypothetical protein
MNDYSSLLGSAAYNYSYLILLLPGIVLGLIAQLLVKTRFASYDKVKSKKILPVLRPHSFYCRKAELMMFGLFTFQEILRITTILQIKFSV